MSYELFQQGPEAYVPILLFSLIITVLAYGAFPFIFAKTRKAPITKKKYLWLCYGVNIGVMIVFIALNDGASNGAPYLLWTWTFSSYGTKILSSKGNITDGKNVSTNKNPYSKCNTTANQYVYLNEKVPVVTNKISFCRKCGNKLLDGASFCNKCGNRIIEENNVQ